MIFETPLTPLHTSMATCKPKECQNAFVFLSKQSSWALWISVILAVTPAYFALSGKLLWCPENFGFVFIRGPQKILITYHLIVFMSLIMETIILQLIPDRDGREWEKKSVKTRKCILTFKKTSLQVAWKLEILEKHSFYKEESLFLQQFLLAILYFD